MFFFDEMGVCMSCLGFGQDDRASDVENGRLLSDPHNMNYGSTSGIRQYYDNVEPDEVRRQRDNLERLCQHASERLIDVSPASTLQSDPRQVTRTNASLFDNVFFGNLPQAEVQQGFQDLGVVNVQALAQNRPHQSVQPIVYEF